eukprot:gene3929-6401_t
MDAEALLAAPLAYLATIIVACTLASLIGSLMMLVTKYSSKLSLKPQLSEQLGNWQYETVKKMISEMNLSLPCMLVDLKTFDRNCLTLAKKASSHGKTIRIATKSLRIPSLIVRALGISPVFQGLMCYNAREAWYLFNYLTKENVYCRDFLIAYPTMELEDLLAASRLTSAGATVVLMVDCLKHVKFLDSWWDKNHPGREMLNVCIDFDMSWRPIPGVHIGAHRSPCRTPKDVDYLLGQINSTYTLKFVGVMGYEAQISGVPDTNPFTTVINPIIRFIKQLSFYDVKRRRRQVRSLLAQRGAHLHIFNGGGTGSALLSASDPSITEIAAGSGLLQSQIFDWFKANENGPAAVIALRCTRSCDEDIICCQSGGFIASGQISKDKQPRPFLPTCLIPFPNEGFGEVQTPLAVKSRHHSLSVGDPVLIRPAKAGEIAEHFDLYHMIDDMSNPQDVAVLPTYRGLGLCFH